MDAATDPTDSMRALSLSDYDSRLVEGCGIAASIALAGLAEHDSGDTLEDAPEGWD